MLITAKVRGVKEEFFAVKRFDRVKNQKLHVISLGGMLEASSTCWLTTKMIM
jgi:hypothetical protein